MVSWPLKMNASKDARKERKKRRQERVATYKAWANDEERRQAVEAALEHALATGLL